MTHPNVHELSGTCAFRLTPDDSLAAAPSYATLARIGTEGFSLSYVWSHPIDGEQQGSLLVGGDGDAGRVEAAWFDTWHQQPGLMHLTGQRTGLRVDVRGSHAGEWGWTISVDLRESKVAMTMCNVVPDAARHQLPPDGPPMSASPYDVMFAEWRP